MIHMDAQYVNTRSFVDVVKGYPPNHVEEVVGFSKENYNNEGGAKPNVNSIRMLSS